MTTFARYLRQRNLTYYALGEELKAARTPVNQVTLQRWGRGKSHGNYVPLCIVARHLGFKTTEELFPMAEVMEKP